MDDSADLPLLHDQDLMLALLRVASRGAARLDDALALIGAELAQAHEPQPPPGSPLPGRLARARDHLLAAQLLRPEGERFALTGRGAAMLARHPEGVDDTVLMQFPEFRRHVARPAAREDPESRAYQQGFAARLYGQSHTANPYRRESAAHQSWENGWFEACDERVTRREE